MKRISFLLGWCGLVAGVTPACVYDSDDRCGPHQVIIESDRCSCEPGYVPGEDGCVACGENEKEASGACVCVDGYARPSAGEACARLPGGLGDECDTESSPCPEGDYPECHAEAGETAGYCTTVGCATSADCEAGYMCQATAGGSYCRRPPVGYGDSCETDEDCAAGDATFCEQVQSNVCLVPCSPASETDCFEGEVCCDLSLFQAGVICTPADACPTQSGG